MDRNGDGGPDGDSIKPVSSLRSHFEKIAHLHSSETAPPNRLTRTGNQNQEDEGIEQKFHHRGSLDVPRKSSPWLAPDSASNMRDSAHESPRKAPAPPPHRPLSMTSLPNLQSPPVVTINVPSSPPKSPFYPQTRRQPAVPSIANGHKGSGPGSLQQMGDLSHSLKTFESSLGVENSTSMRARSPRKVQGHRPVNDNREATRESSAPAARQREGPPPVNRAEKPKLLLKPAMVNDPVGIRPASPFTDDKAFVDDKVSPFSTPPSSDEDNRSDATYRTPSRTLHGSSKHFMDGRRTNVQTKSPGVVAYSRGSNNGNDARAYGFGQMGPPSTNQVEMRPALPIRRHMKDDCLPISTSSAPSLPSSSPENPIETMSSSAFLPPPRRTVRTKAMAAGPQQPLAIQSLAKRAVSLHQESPQIPHGEDETNVDRAGNVVMSEFPDISRINRSWPFCQAGARRIELGYDARLIDICGRHACTAGHVAKVWDVTTGEVLVSTGQFERDIKITAIAFMPGEKSSDEGSRLWLGTNYGDLQEVDIAAQSVGDARTGPHERHPIARIHRHQNSMWTIDDNGKLCVWPGDNGGLPSLQSTPTQHRVQRGHACSLIVQDALWLASGKDIRIYRPGAADIAAYDVLQLPLSQTHIGLITSCAVIAAQTDRVYFGHADGKVSVYSAIGYDCLGIVAINVYKITSLVGAGAFLWATFSMGTISVHDTATRPWTAKKSWMGHQGQPIHKVSVDRSSLWKDGILRLASVGSDGVARFWDGSLQDDWLGVELRAHDVEYSSFRDLSALVMTWNAGAATPSHLRHNSSDSQFFENLLHVRGWPDMLVLGFQELVDLEDKKLTAKTLFKGNKRKDPAEQEHMSRQYRAWRDYLVKCVEESSSTGESYDLVHTASLVGLFSCVFIKHSQRGRLREVSAAEVKRGMGGLHGNKGALIMRFILDDTSICLVNCHLAAGQTQTTNRSADITAILEAEGLPPEKNSGLSESFIGGGDGSIIFDHDICILAGDMNYRIDTMGRDAVIKAVNANNLEKLLERDQLLVSQRRNPTFAARAFREAPITFAPTYKYDTGTDRYDTSEKRRAPAWCDRILHRGESNIKQIDYQRHDLRVSDHRPVSALFLLRIRNVSPEKRAKTRAECETRLQAMKQQLATDAKIEYLRDVLGVPLKEAKRLV